MFHFFAICFNALESYISSVLKLLRSENQVKGKVIWTAKNHLNEKENNGLSLIGELEKVTYLEFFTQKLQNWWFLAPLVIVSCCGPYLILNVSRIFTAVFYFDTRYYSFIFYNNCIALSKLCENMGFHWPIFPRLVSENRFSENPYPCIFYAACG